MDETFPPNTYFFAFNGSPNPFAPWTFEAIGTYVKAQVEAGSPLKSLVIVSANDYKLMTLAECLAAIDPILADDDITNATP